MKTGQAFIRLIPGFQIPVVPVGKQEADAGFW